MEKLILTDEGIYPDTKEIKKNLSRGDYEIYDKLTKQLEGSGYVIEWRYYNDGKSWLAKILSGKKNAGWLSIWDTGVKVTVYFSQRTVVSLLESNVAEKVKNLARNTKPIGKLVPVIMPLKTDEDVDGALGTIECKSKL